MTPSTPFDRRMLEALVCPVTPAILTYDAEAQELISKAAHPVSYTHLDVYKRQVLERYERWRRFDSTTLALGMDTVNRLFSNDNPLLRAGRDLGMGLVNALPGLRRGFIRQAAGLTGELPRLLAGKPL